MKSVTIEDDREYIEYKNSEGETCRIEATNTATPMTDEQKERYYKYIERVEKDKE